MLQYQCTVNYCSWGKTATFEWSSVIFQSQSLKYCLEQWNGKYKVPKYVFQS